MNFEHLYKTSSVNMASIIGTVGEFKDGEDTWNNYIARLEQFFVANDIGDVKKKRAILLTSVGARTFKLICSLTQPQQPSDIEFAVLVQLIKDHQSPKPSMIVQRFKFNSRVRKADESVRTYVAELRKLSEYCEYNSQLDDMLRDRLVCGIGDVRIQTRLLSEKNLTFQKAYDSAVAMETATENSKSISSMSISEQGASVNVLQKGSYSKNKSFKNERSGDCFRCGNRHDQKQCKYKDSTCYGCGKVGHPKFNCRSSPRDEDQGQRQERREHNRNYDLSETVVEEFYDFDLHTLSE